MPSKVTEAEIKLHLATLSATPQHIATCVQGLDEVQLTTPSQPKEWSVNEILAHLRGCVEVWGYSIYMMLLVDAPELPDVHPRDWSKKLDYAHLSFAENFQAFQVERTNLIWVLQNLTFEDWERSATFKGKVNTHTIFSQVRRMALHELDHCQQLETMFPRN